MSQSSLDEFLRDNHDAVLAAVTTRMHGDSQMLAVAGQRQLSDYAAYRKRVEKLVADSFPDSFLD
jgi:hypothetical protein